MSDTIITSITSIVSLSIGWLLNEFGSWFKERRENKRIRKNVLYHLLEIQFSLRKLDISKELNAVSEITMRLIPKEEHVEGLKEGLNTIYQAMLANLLEQNVGYELKTLEVDYLKSIESLSSVDPIMAYRLKGKTKILDGLEMINSSVGNLQNVIGEFDATSLQEQQKLISLLRPEIIQALIKDLREEIIDLSKSIGFFTKKEVISMHKSLDKTIDNSEDFKKYEIIIKDVIGKLTQLPSSN